MAEITHRPDNSIDETRYSRVVDTANHNENRLRVAELVDLFTTHNHGDIVAWASIHGATKVSSREDLYPIIGRARRLLIQKHGIFLETRPGVGYRICPPGEEINQCTGHFRSGIQRMNRATKDANHIRLDQMVKKERDKTIEKTQKMANFVAMIPVGVND